MTYLCIVLCKRVLFLRHIEFFAKLLTFCCCAQSLALFVFSTSQDAACEDIMDDMNELLSSNQFLHFLKRGTSASQVVEVVHVDINQDFSHVTAFWRSSFINKFIAFTVQEEQEKEGGGEAVAQKLHRRFTKLINAKLQDAEPKFRSNLLKTMTFRRVPRIFFKPIGARRQKQQSSYDGSNNEQRQQFLRDNSAF